MGQKGGFRTGIISDFYHIQWQRGVPKLINQRDSSGKILIDEEGRFIKKEEICPEYFEERRALLFDFDGSRAKLEHFTWLPRNRWAKELWFPVENWLEIQPNIEAKIEFWQKEVALRTDALRQAQQRLEALKRVSPGLDTNLDPQTQKWLQTAAVLGGTKKAAPPLKPPSQKPIY